MSFRIKYLDRDTRARTATLSLPHGEISTPAFMPVGTNATVKAVWPRDLRSLGFGLILANAYHLFLRPGIKKINRSGGLHRFMGWDGNLLTDSGGFQIFSLAPLREVDDEGVTFRSHLDGSRHRLTPESVVELQIGLGSDIVMPLDVCAAPDVGIKEAERASDITTRWAVRAAAHWRNREEGSQQLWGIVQGGHFPRIRARSIAQIEDLGLPGTAIGGLSLGESRSQFETTIGETGTLLDPSRPHYLMGVGSPDLILCGVEHGIDLFDSVYPTRIARNAQALTHSGPLSLRSGVSADREEPIDSKCGCLVCDSHSRAYLRHLFKSKEIMAPILTTYHNLAFLSDLMNAIRTSISSGDFLALKNNFLEEYLFKSENSKHTGLGK